MPELPEVETVMRGLAGRLAGQTIRAATTHRDGMRWPFPRGLAQSLAGQRILGFVRRGKYILMRLGNQQTLLLHLGMSGRMVITASGPAEAPGLHEHLVLQTASGARVGFVDPRRFGVVDLLPTADEGQHRLLAGMGPEPLEDSFTPAMLGAALAGRRIAIKAALLDQKIVAGLGNIYVSEALFRARISPRRLAASVPGARAARLVPAIRATLQEAIAAGGSSLRDYVQPSGALGYFQHAWKVYGRAGQPCERCPGAPTCRGISRITQSGRSSFFCARTQS